MSTARLLRTPRAHLTPTLLDRLSDAAPHRATESPAEQVLAPSQVRDIILRDLGYLLNTTAMRPSDLDAARFPEVAASTLNYGLPPLAEGYVSDQHCDAIVQAIKRAIRHFEPRLDPDTLDVRHIVELDTQCPYNVLVFEISGQIRMQPYPMAFLVRSILDMDTAQFKLQTTR